MYDTSPADRHCASDTRCRAYNHVDKHAAWVDPRTPLCDDCLSAAERDVRILVFDYVDLAQLQAPSMSQALDAQPHGKAGPPMPLRAEPEALQAEIHHVATLWAGELRTKLRLANPQRAYIVGAWHTTATNPPPPPRRQHGSEVQEAVDTLTPRLRDLAQLAPHTVYPTGSDDDPQDMAGWEAVHHLQHLHQRARGMLGRTHRTKQVPGTCPTCDGDLYRDDPRYPEDPCPVYCATDGCGQQWSHDEYEAWAVDLLLAPKPRGKATT